MACAEEGSRHGRGGTWTTVHVYGIRTFEDITVIDGQPAIDGSPAAITHQFIQNLVGTNRNTVVSIDIRAQPGQTRCGCGASDQRRGSTAERLSALCGCVGATGTVVFSDEESATTFVRLVRQHHSLHPRGFLSQTEVGGQLDIKLCDDCCLFNKQVGCTERRPSRAGDEIEDGDNRDGPKPVTYDLTLAIAALLQGILRGQNAREVEDARRKMLGKSIREAKALAETQLQTLLISYEAPDEPAELLFFDQGWELILQAKPSEYGKTAAEFIELLNATDPQTQRSLLAETTSQHGHRDPHRSLASQPARVSLAPGQTDLPLAAYETGHARLGQANTPIVRDTADLEENVRNTRRLLDRLDRAIKESDSGKFIGLDFEIQSMIDAKQQVMTAFNIVAKMFRGSGFPDTPEHDNLRATFLELTRRKDALMAAICAKQRMAWDSRMAIQAESRTLAVTGLISPYSPDPDVPSDDDVDHELKRFYFNLQMLRSIEAQVSTVVYDRNVADKRNEMISIRKDTEHHARQVLWDLNQIAKKATEWLRLSGHLSPCSDRRRSLDKIVTEVREQELTWRRLTSRIQELDRLHGFSSHDPVAPALLKDFHQGIFYGGQDNRPSQNILEWCKDLEKHVLPHFPTQPEKIRVAMHYLAKRIADIAKLRHPDTWMKLKEFLLDQYLDEERVLAHWLNQLIEVGAQRLRSGDIGCYISQISGTIKEIRDCTGLRPSITRKLFQRDNVTSLISTVLQPLHKVTGQDQYQRFAIAVYEPMCTEAEMARSDLDMSAVLTKLENRLEEIKHEEKYKLEVGKGAQVSTQSRLNHNSTKYAQELHKHLDKLRSEGHPDPWKESSRRALAACGEGPPRGPAKHTRDTNQATGAPNIISNPCVTVLCYPVMPGGSTEFLGYRVTAASGSKLTPKPQQVLVNQDTVKQGKDWHGSFKLRCWVCPSTARAHEFMTCHSALKASNRERLKAAKDPNRGPGLQCFSCLSAVCFAERCIALGKIGLKARLPLCKVNNRDFGCSQCWKEIRNDSKKRGNFKSHHVTICCVDGHVDAVNNTRTLESLKKAYGAGMTRVQIHTVMLPATVTQVVGRRHIMSHQTDFDNDRSTDGSLTLSMEDEGRFEELGPISLDEYPDVSDNDILDTQSGRTVELDTELNNERIVTESDGQSVYFMQMLHLKGQTVLCFYDSGAQLSLIKTSVARALKLPMVDRSGLYLVGAGNKITATSDGTYELVLGQGPNGEIYKFRASGMPELTSDIAQYNWTSVHDEVRTYGAQVALKQQLPAGSRLALHPDEILPHTVGGTQVELLIGLKLPALQPVNLFNLPGGLSVARGVLCDVNGSRIMFGGVHNQFANHLDTHFVGQYKVAPYAEYNRRCFQLYLQYRDSIYPDEIFIRQKPGSAPSVQVKQWAEITADESCEMIDESPFILAGSEEKRSVQMHKEQFYHELGLEAEEEASVLLGSQPGVLSHQDYPSSNFPEVEQAEPAQLGKGTIESGDIQPDSCSYGAPETVVDHNYDSWYEYSFNRSKLAALINTTVDDCFGLPYGNGLTTSVNQSDFLSQDVIYENDEDRTRSLSHVAPDKGLQGIFVQTKLCHTERAPDIESVGLRGSAAFKAAAPLNWGFTHPTHACDNCTCQGPVGLTSDPEVTVPLFNYRGVNKLKQMIRKWEDEEDSGTGVRFRCPRCQDCPDCLKSGKTRARSIREDDEQAVIESSVRIDYATRKCTVVLPFIRPPIELTAQWGASSNYKQARAFLTRMGKASPEDRRGLAAFWKELECRQVVQKLVNLPPATQELISASPVKHFYPWNFVQKPGSPSTPVRIVMDSRQSGLNNFLAKGLNSLNNLQMLIMLWRTYKHVGTFDIGKMYNMLHIDDAHLCYQLILWQDQMEPTNPVEIWVVTRAIYGTISSGNQAEVAIRRGATQFQKELPEGAHTIIHETYVDDGMPGRNSPVQLHLALDQVKTILERIGFNLKCTVVNGQEVLDKKASSDGINISIAGYNWKPRTDVLGLSRKECNFHPSIRGRKQPNRHSIHSGDDISIADFPPKFTRAMAVGKVAEVFDPLGYAMPITMRGKIKCREYTHLDWKAPVPDEDRGDWLDLVKLIQDARNLEFDRCVLPSNSDTGEIELLEVNDGSQHGCAAAIYVRSRLDDGKTSSCKLLFSRSALCPPGQSIPRNELAGAHLGAVTIYMVKSALKDRVGPTYAFTDSNVVMCWLQNPQLKLKNWVMARVKEVLRLTSGTEFFWVKGEENIADLATKGLVSLVDIDPNSNWQNGFPWMNGPLETARRQEIIRTYEDVMLKLDAKEQKDLAAEQHPSLPDLANGRRHQGPSELVSNELLITTQTMLQSDEFRLYDLRGANQANPGLLLEVTSKASGYQYCVLSNSMGHPATSGINKDWYGSNGAPEITTFSLTYSTSRSKLPIGRQSLEFPEEHSLITQDCCPELVRSAMLTYPPDLHLMPGGVNLTRIEVSAYVVNPIYYGFRKAFRVATVFMYYKYRLIHAAHQIPSQNSHGVTGMSKARIKVREGLKSKCYVCTRLQVNFRTANLAYLDQLTSGVAKITTEDCIERVESGKIWEAGFTVTSRDKLTYGEVMSNRALLDQPFRQYVQATARARAKKLAEKKPPSQPRPVITGSPGNDTLVTLDSHVDIGDDIKSLTWQHFMRKCSLEVTETLNNMDKRQFTLCQDGIWRYYGRLQEREGMDHKDIVLREFFDADSISYVQPVGLANSPFVYTLVTDLHWKVNPHCSVYKTNRLLSSIMYVIKGGNLTKAIRDGCLQCRRIAKRTMVEKMGNIPLEKLIISPPFYAVQIDDCGPFVARSAHNFRSKITFNALVITCINTSAVSIWVLETGKAPSVLKAIQRHSYRYGYPAVAYIDLGPGLVKGCEQQVMLSNHSTLLRQSCGMRVVPKPPQAHSQRGKVERAVQMLKKWIKNRELSLLTQSLLDWETTFAFISNFLNNQPMARLSRNRSLTTDLNEIITPNRLLLGRNNQRCPTFIEDFKSGAKDYEARLLKNSQINQAWYELYLKSVPTMVYRPKWFKSSEHPPEVGDYVLFRHTESTFGTEHDVWRIGLVTEVGSSQSSTTLVFTLAYKVATRGTAKKAEDWSIVDHSTTRVLRELVLLCTEAEIASPVGSDEHRRRERIADQYTLAGYSVEDNSAEDVSKKDF